MSNSIKVYNYLIDYENDLNDNNNNDKYKKIIIEIDNHQDTIQFLNSKKKYSKNVKFYLHLDEPVDTEIIFNKNKNIINNNIKSISLYNIEWKRQFIFQLLNSGIKEFHYSSDINSNINFTLNFEKSNKNQIIDINNLLLPNNKDNNYNNNKINKLFLELNIQKLLLSTIHDGGILFDKKEDFIKCTKDRWNNIINKLSNDSTLKELNISHNCQKDCKCQNFNYLSTDIIMDGFNQIISNSKSIQSLFYLIKINNSNLINFYKSINNNKSILNLSFLSDYLIDTINNIFLNNNNNTIRNLYIYTRDINHLLNSLLLLKDTDLYSITFELSVSNSDLNVLLDLLKSNQFLIKEFIILNDNQYNEENDDEDGDDEDENDVDDDENDENGENGEYGENENEESEESENEERNNLIYYTIKLKNTIIKVLTQNKV